MAFLFIRPGIKDKGPEKDTCVGTHVSNRGRTGEGWGSLLQDRT